MALQPSPPHSDRAPRASDTKKGEIPTTLDKDILHLIFLSGSQEHSQSFPHRVSTVCHSWRDLALDTSALWTTIRFVGTINLEKAEERIRRAGTALLDIEIKNVWGKADGLLHEDLEKIFPILLPLSPRWRSLSTFQGNKVPSCWVAPRLRGVPAPKLEVLCLPPHERDVVTDWGGPPTVQLFEGPTPRLKELRVPEVAIDPRRFHLSPNLRSIEVERRTFAKDQEVAASQIRTILSDLPRLELLRVITSNDIWYKRSQAPEAAPAFPDVVHDCLKQLAVTNLPLMNAVLCTTHLPNVISIDNEIYPESFVFLSKYNPFPHLESITLDVAWRTPPEDLIQHLQYLPAVFRALTCLKSITFINYTFSDEFWVKALDHLCPKLEAITMQRCRGISEDAFKEMIQARIEAPNMQRIDLLAVVLCTAIETSNKWQQWLTDNIERVWFRDGGFL